MLELPNKKKESREDKTDCSILLKKYNKCLERPTMKYKECYLFYNMYNSCLELCKFKLIKC